MSKDNEKNKKSKSTKQSHQAKSTPKVKKVDDGDKSKKDHKPTPKSSAKPGLDTDKIKKIVPVKSVTERPKKKSQKDIKLTDAESKKITKKDPEEEIKPWLDFKKDNSNKKKSRTKKTNVGPSLSNLKRERRRAIITKLGILLIISLVAVIGLVYYLSPISLTQKIVVQQNRDIPVEEVIKSSGLKTNEHILGQLFKKEKIEKRLKYDYPSIKRVEVKLQDPTTLLLKLTQNDIIAYLQKGAVFQKILTNGAISTETIVPAQLDGKPIFIGYKKGPELSQDIKLFKKLPVDIQKNVRLLNGKTERDNQIVMVMKDQNIIIGDTDTIIKKIKFYSVIKKQLAAPSVVDFEIGAFSRPITENDKKSYLQ